MLLLRSASASSLFVLAAWLAAAGCGFTSPAPSVRASASARPADDDGGVQRDGVSSPERELDERALAALDDAALASQIRRVVLSMDASGRPPRGVVQGGRRRGPRGNFQNAEGRLPRRPPGYYEESDVWPPGPQGRGRLRLVFGREREVYFSGDHYRSFVRLR